MIGKRLRELRISNGFTQKQIADVLNIDRSTYSYYETRKTQPDINVIKRLAAMYDVTCDYILNYEQSKPDIFSGSEIDYRTDLSGEDRFLTSLSQFEESFILHLRLLSPERQEELFRMAKEETTPNKE